MKPSELIKVLQQAVDAGQDNETVIQFDTEGRSFDYHMAEVGSAYFNSEDAVGYPFISLHEKSKIETAMETIEEKTGALREEEPQEIYCMNCGAEKKDLAAIGGPYANGIHWQCKICKEKFVW